MFGGSGQSLYFDGGNHGDVDRNDEDCREFRTGHGAGSKNETAAPFSVSEAGYRVKSGALYMS